MASAAFPSPRIPLHRRAVAAVGALVLAASSGVVLGPAPWAHAEDKDDKIKRKQEIDQQIEDLRGQLADVDQDLSDTYLALARTELEIPDAQQTLDDAQTELDDARLADQQTGERLTTAQQEEQRLQGESDEGQQEVDRSDEEMREVSLDAYKGGGVPNPATVFLGSADPQDAVDRSMNYRLTLESQGTRLDTLRTDQSVTDNATDRLGAVRTEIADLKVQAEQAVERKEEAEEGARTAKQTLDDLYAQQTQQKTDLEDKKTQFEGQETDLQGQSSTLDSEIQELTRTEREAAQAGTPTRTVPDNGGTGGASASGFIRPVPGKMNSTFGWRYHPIYHTRKFHAGDDFPVACGTPVHAAQDGQVIKETSGTAAGNKVIVSHGVMNGKVMTTSYHHLQKFAVSEGTSVKRGDVVGYVGTTGSSTGCHLHFEVHEDGTPVDPAGYV